MLVGGGLYDQPVEWFSASYAVYLWQFLEKIGAKDFKFGDLKGSEHDLYDQIREIRKAKCRP